ncbi:MAG: HAD family hydrolase [Faecalibacterium sp.]|jgi:phosphoglycolate phosphatase|nr:HAD family hydrolase [Faecalibacterium sp.]
MRKLIIFDFDGTLADTLTDVALCFNEALRQNGFAPHPLAAFGGFVGGNLETVVSRMLPPGAVTPENIDRVKLCYRALYLHSKKPNTAPYPGIPALLEKLRAAGRILAVNSNKGQKLLDDMVEKTFPQGTFAAVVGYEESRPSKPDPAGIDEICRACGLARADAVYVGDGQSDVDTAVRAGIPCVFVAWGQGDHALAAAPGVAAAADAAQQLETILLGQI